MQIKIDLNSKELSSLVGDNKDPIAYNFDINLYTEARKSISHKEETAVFTGLLWALCTMLPHVVIQSIFRKWNEIVGDLHKGLEEGKKVSVKVIDK